MVLQAVQVEGPEQTKQYGRTTLQREQVVGVIKTYWLSHWTQFVLEVQFMQLAMGQIKQLRLPSRKYPDMHEEQVETAEHFAHCAGTVHALHVLKVLLKY